MVFFDGGNFWQGLNLKPSKVEKKAFRGWTESFPRLNKKLPHIFIKDNLRCQVGKSHADFFLSTEVADRSVQDEVWFTLATCITEKKKTTTWAKWIQMD